MSKTPIHIFLTVCLAVLVVACGDEKDILFQAGEDAFEECVLIYLFFPRAPVRESFFPEQFPHTIPRGS